MIICKSFDFTVSYYHGGYSKSMEFTDISQGFTYILFSLQKFSAALTEMIYSFNNRKHIYINAESLTFYSFGLR